MAKFTLRVDFDADNAIEFGDIDIDNLYARYREFMGKLNVRPVESTAYTNSPGPAQGEVDRANAIERAKAEPATPPDPWASDRNDWPGEAAVARAQVGQPQGAPQAAPGAPQAPAQPYPGTTTQPPPTQSQAGAYNSAQPGTPPGPNPGYAPNAAPQYPPQQSYAQPAAQPSNMQQAPMCAHGPMKYIQGGFSQRTGRAYAPFWACPTAQGAPDKCPTVKV